MFSLKILLTSAAAFVAAFAGTMAHGAERPNVILMMCDDLGWGDVGFNGNRIIRTPNLDALASGGLTWDRFYAAAPVCSPTRRSCLTGRHPYRYGIPHANTGHMKPEERTLAELLKQLGYRTGHFGKWHLGTLSKTEVDSNRGGPRGIEFYAPPWENGFDVCFSTEAKVPTWDPMLKPATGAGGRGWEAIEKNADATSYGTYYWTESGGKATDNLRGDDSRVIMDRVVPFVTGAVEDGQPFFAVVWFHAPHLPVVAGPRYAAMYAEYNSYGKNYYGCITAMDEQVGRLREQLQRLDAEANTMWWFCSDNGPEGSKGSAPGSAGPFRGRKRSLYEGGVRVPGLLHWPARVKPNSRTDFPACTSDYLPTILAAVGANPVGDRPLDGMSLLDVFDGRITHRATPIGFEFQGKVALVGDRYKLICETSLERIRNKGPEEKRRSESNKTGVNSPYQLFDLVADPGETRDLAARHPEIVDQMQTMLESWRARCRASAAGKDY